MSLPRIVIAGTHSGVGKTTVATGLMVALRRRGMRVQGFKIGPDFIDPTFHKAATGRTSHNLDGWMLTREANLEIFARATQDADVAVIEGVMGMFDGKQSPSLAGTTAEMALWLEASVVLVIDASSMAGSAAAIVHGFDSLVSELGVCAVVCNRVGTDRHFNLLRDAITSRCRPALLGRLPRDPEKAIPERHLGLHLADEATTAEKLDQLGAWIEQHLDLDQLLRLAKVSKAEVHLPVVMAPTRARIAVARDAAFCFYYQDNLNLLEQLGVELVPFSPISDTSLPQNIDGIYLGGGYPELHAEALSTNQAMLEQIRRFALEEGPMYAECGGFMYLMDAIVDIEGREWPMTSIFPTKARVQKRLAKLGYIEVTHSGLGGQTARGHEFRYSQMDPMPAEVTRVYHEPAEGFQRQSVLASYIHLHFLSCPTFAEQFVDQCAARRQKN